VSADNTVWALAGEFQLPEDVVDPLLTRRREGASDAAMLSAIARVRGACDMQTAEACLAMIDRILGLTPASPPPALSSPR
jgi:hypothetical protein